MFAIKPLWPHHHCVNKTTLLWLLRQLTTSGCSCNKISVKSHYVALGITPKATQADVKAAYYRLSKMYHPDSQATAGQDENTEKFREVTAAYEILGNVKMRRLYDKGMHHMAHPMQPASTWRPPDDDDPALKFYKSREVRSRPPPPTGSSPVYNFDEWSKQHYGATFARDQTIRKRQAARQTHHQNVHNDIKVERVLIAMGVIFVSVILLSCNSQNYDEVKYKRDEID